MQTLDFFRIKFNHDADYNLIDEPLFECESCQKLIPEHKKRWMTDPSRAEWRATKPGSDPSEVGRMIPSTYSLLGYTWRDMAKEWLEAVKAKKNGDLTLMIHFFNTRLALPWEQQKGDSIEHSDLFNRRENYIRVPGDVVVLVSGVDVQINRLEVSVIGYSQYQSWGILHKIIGGDPTLAYGSPNSPWNDLEKFLDMTFPNEEQYLLPIALSCVDTGNWTVEVMAFLNHPKIKSRRHKIYGIKGASTPGKSLVSNPNKDGVFLIGTDVAKESIFFNLQKTNPSDAGYTHFNQSFGEEYFKQLTAEELKYKYVNGRRVKYWHKPKHVRNETLDCMVYSKAAVYILNPNWNEVLKNRKLKRRHKTPSSKKKAGKGFVKNW
jgi:phage terminase large subunit GpA-like protein